MTSQNVEEAGAHGTLLNFVVSCCTQIFNIKLNVLQLSRRILTTLFDAKTFIKFLLLTFAVLPFY